MVEVPAGDWIKLDFSLTSTEETTCEGIRASDYPDIDCSHSTSPTHPCIRCGGQIVVSLAGAGEVWVNYVFVQPGEWGRFAGLQVLREPVEWLQSMGVTSIRCACMPALLLDLFRHTAARLKCYCP